MRTRIDHGLIWSEGRLRNLSILIEDGKISTLVAPGAAPKTPADQVFEAGGCWVLPGGIDFHVHISDGIETFENGTRGAVAGGLTTVLDMAQFHGCITIKQFEQKIHEINNRCAADVAIIAGIVVDATDLTEMEKLSQNGAAYFKVFQPAEPAVSNHTLWEAVQIAAKTGLRMGIHAEDPACFKHILEGEGALAFAHSRPEAAETSAVALVIEMAHAAGAPIHICHVSCARTAELVARAKAEGTDVTCEIPAHFLLLDETAYEKYGARVKTTPPLRKHHNPAELWNYLSSGVIDVLACDHYVESAVALPNDPYLITDAPAGIAGIEVSLPLLFDAVIRKIISLARFVQITAEIPAKIAGIDHYKGTIAPGFDADLVFWNPEENRTLSDQGSFSRISTTPFQGWQVNGSIKKTMVRGKEVWNGESITTPTGYGKWVPSRRNHRD